MKKVLVTGSNGDIGKAIALKFLKKNFFVYCHVRSGESSENIKLLSDEFKNIKIISCDFNQELIEEKFSSLDEVNILINNAGYINRSKEFNLEEYRKTLEINLIKPLEIVDFLKNKGLENIVNIGSIRGFNNCSTSLDYSASKAGLHNATTALAKKLSPNIRVNAIAPGFIKTKLHINNEKRLQQEAEKTPLKKIGNTQDIAEVSYFLSSEKANFITGAIIPVDGGRSIVN